MDNKNEPKKPNRLKFSRLCLSQTRNAGAVRTQLPNSQISRFFSQPNQTIENISKAENPSAECLASKKSITSAENNDTLQNVQNICDKPSTDSKETNEDSMKHSIDKRKIKSVHRIAFNDSKSTIKSFFSNEHNDSMADFEIPNKVAKRVSKPVQSKTTKYSRTRRKQPDIRKALNKRDEATTDYSHLPEDAQLELALALSKAEADHVASDTVAAESINFDAFEFKPKNANGDLIDFFNMPSRKNARFKWNSKCTQLTKRDDAVQKSKITQKVHEFLENNINVESYLAKLSQSEQNVELAKQAKSYEIYSTRLQRICMPQRILFNINSCDLHSNDNILSYYTNNLVNQSKLKSGVLLRDWSKIPGRDSIYDGVVHTNEEDKTDKPVMTSQPEAIESNEPGDVLQQRAFLDSPKDVPDDQDCEQGQIQTQCNDRVDEDYEVSMQYTEQNQNDILDADDDVEATIVMESDDIQLKIDAINSKIRLSQNFSDIFQPTVVTLETTHSVRAPSPDLFDDDDDIEMTDDIHEKNKESNDEQIVLEVVSDGDTEEIAASDGIGGGTSSDIVLISSSECNSNQAPSIQNAQSTPPIIDSEENLNIVDTIDLLDSDSENMTKEPISSPAKDPENASPVECNYDIYNYEYENEDYIQRIDVDVDRPNASINKSIKSNESVGTTKKLSFTERLEFCDRDVLNGFTGNIPAECYSQIVQSQESISLSDDEINYSMNKGGDVQMTKDDDENADDMDYYNCYMPSPIDFNLIDANINNESDEKLMNQSVCNIFEKTFEHNNSPGSTATKRKTIGAKSLKKVSSDMTIVSRYENVVPSTSTVDFNRVNVTPTKHRNESPKKRKASQCSQTAVNQRQDLSNDEYFIRVGSVSPKPNYEQMNSTTLKIELGKFGLKPSLSRRQAIICLEYIYNRTHPIMEGDVEKEDAAKENVDVPKDENNGPKINYNIGFAAHNLTDEKFKKHEETSIFLPSALRAKKPWCLQPLHVAWHNLIKANSELRKAVLLYEPIHLIELKKFFKTIDMTFDNRDLIAFLDMHCITFRMNKASKE